MATLLGDGVSSILKDIEDPMRNGIGASINQNKTKATDTSHGQALSNTNFALFTVGGGFGGAFGQGINSNTSSTTVTTKKTSQGNMERAAKSALPAERLSQEIFGNTNNYVSTLVDEMLDATVFKQAKESIRKGQLSLATSKLGTTYATVVAYYKKLYDGSFIMNQLRNKTEKNISKLINQRINDKIFNWEKNLPGWTRILIGKSKIASQLTKSVNLEIKNMIGGIFTDKLISNINDGIIGNLKKIKNTLNETITTKFKDQIANAVKLRSAITEKIKQFWELKKQYEQKIFKAIKSFKKKIVEAITTFTKKLVGTLTDSVKALFTKPSTGAAKA